MDTLLSLPAAVGLVLVLASARQESLDEARAALFERGVAQAEELVETCQRWGLYAERDRLCEALIQLDPEHAEARRTLGYRHTTKGWVRSARRAARNHRTEGLEELGRLRPALARCWSDDVRALYGRLDPDGEREDRMLADVLILAPDDPEARARRGEVRDAGGAWVLADTVRSRAQRATQERCARAIREGAVELEPLEGEQAGERDAPIAWRQALGARHARLYASGSDPRAPELLRAAEQSGALFELAFGERPSLPPDFAIYLVEGERAKRDFLAHHPRAEGCRRGAGQDRDGWFDGGSALVFWDGAGRENVQRVVCEGLRCMLRRSFGLRSEHAWALEGFELRLCELAGAAVALGGERMPARGGTRAAAGPWARVRELASAGRLPSLRGLFEDRDGTLGPEQELLAYALARYLLECHARDVGRLLDDLGHGGLPLERCLQSVLGLDGERLERRLRRWIVEVG